MQYPEEWRHNYFFNQSESSILLSSATLLALYFPHLHLNNAQSCTKSRHLFASSQKPNHKSTTIAALSQTCWESQFPKFAVYENTKNHVEITRHKNLSFCSKILVFARPWNSTNQRLSHFWWSRETLIQVKYCTACHFHGKQFYWTKGWKNLIGWERKRWIRWNCQMIIRWYENEPIRK